MKTRFTLLIAALFLGLLMSCKKKEKEVPQSSDPKDFFHATINDTLYEIEYPMSSYGLLYQPYSIGEEDPYSCFMYMVSFNDCLVPANEFIRTAIVADSLFMRTVLPATPPRELTWSEFSNHFPIGEKIFCNDALDKNGYAITFTDSNQKFWSTSLGDQTGSSLTFTKVTKARDRYEGDCLRIVGAFSGKLYDAEGNMITMSNGTFQMSVDHKY